MENYILIIIAIFFDLLIGDPVTPIHPVRLIGKFIQKIENFLYNKKLTKRISGFLGVGISIGTVLGFFSLLFQIVSFVPFGKEIFTILVFYSTIAIRDLALHGIRVKKALENKDISLARKNAGMILSRDTNNLSTEKIITGTVESMSENSSDSIIAPVFWGLILGPVGSLIYRVINTMDAMWGYKNTRYIDFGRTAAILDDIVNYIPARLTGGLICITSILRRNKATDAWKIMIRDHSKTPSPNAGYPEAAIAGALGIQLGGEASYFGKIIHKPTIGNNTRTPDAGDISQSLKIIAVSVLTFIILSGIVVAFIQYLYK